MSWLAAVTGKAEDFLNKLDKSAADVLHSDEVRLKDSSPAVQEPALTEPLPASTSAGLLTPSHSVPSRLHKYSSEADASSSSFVSASVKSSLTARTTSPAVSITAPAASSQVSGKTPKQKSSDEALFDFLNSKDTLDSGKIRPTPVTSHQHSRQSSISSVVSSASKGAKSESGVTNVSDSTFPPASSLKITAPSTSETDDKGFRQDSPTNSHVSADVDIIADAMKESPVGSDQSAPDSDHAEAGSEQKDRQLSSLELENRLLRNEVTSLNDEMATVITRAKDAESELMRAREKLKARSSSASMHEQLIRELQARESDLTEALKAKDAQLAVLRVRLEESDKIVLTKEKTLEEVRLERERILKDHSDSSGLHGQALDSMKEKLQEVEAALWREQAAYKQVQQESVERQNRLEQEVQSMAESLAAAQKKMTDERVKVTELTSQLKAAKMNAESARKELSEYKEKAARILQSKEKLITSMRDGSSAVGDAGVPVLEYESLRQERDMIREELQQAKLTVENLRVELQDVENQLQQEIDTSQETIRSLEGSLKEEKRKKEDAELELLKQKQELQYTLDELHKQKSAFQARISDRESEIEKLRNQLMTKSMSSNTESELESRVRTLTESLIQKQTILEALSTEKNSLVLQLERMEHQYRDLENAMPRVPSTSQLVAVSDHDDEVRQRLPLFLREVPTDHEVTRRMKRAANSIDGFSIRLGVFLRRYPMARLFVILYMALLHIWVLIVMMTYQPEIHGMDYQPRPPEV